MPLEQTVTIVNNSGKIISTGKQLLSIFKEAKASYDEKKAEVKGMKRLETLDQTRSVKHRDSNHRPQTLARHATYEPERSTEYSYGMNSEYHDARRRSFDAYSETSSRQSHRNSPSHARHGHHSFRSRPALTERNLKTLSEISSTAPSKLPPEAYRSPYVETLPMNSAVSRINLTQYDMKSEVQTDWRQSTVAPSRLFESEIAKRPAHQAKEIDMNLAYGNVPPDLADRVDLDPAMADEHQANQLIRRVENLLDEAHCIQHSATSIIKHLQERPDAAAAVALTLAELSSVIGKMSPAFLGLLKSASPAVFALLASPQFLIGTSIAVGLTVVMFGGWKIVKRVKEQQAHREPIAWESTPMNRRPPPLTECGDNYAGAIDEALIVDDELSTIETWRRGIMPPGADNESADIELITPEAERAQREKHAKDESDRHSHRSMRTSRTSKTSKTSKTQKAPKTSKTQKTSSRGKEKEVSERRSSRRATVESINGDSELGSRRSSKKDNDKEHRRDRGIKMIEDGRSNGMELVYRPKAQNRGENMLKALFKNKDRKDQQSRTELVMA